MSAELSAWRTAAGAAAADFRREADMFIHDDSLTLPAPDYCSWAFRLSSELQSLLGQLDTEAEPDSLVRLGENAILRQALADAIAYRDPAGACPDCDVHPAGLCADHAGDLDKTDAYLELARQLGIEVER